MGPCELCKEMVQAGEPKRTFVTATDQRGRTAHDSCLKRVSWTPEVQFSGSIHVDGLRDVLTQHHVSKGQAPLLVWSGLRVRLIDAGRRDHRCVWCKGACGDDEDLDTLCVLDSHVKPHTEWHATQWIHRGCIDPAMAARRLVRIARNYHCFSGLRLKS